MNVGYTQERARDLAARLQQTARKLDAAAAVVECSRRVASHPSHARRTELLEALAEYDRRCPCSSRCRGGKTI